MSYLGLVKPIINSYLSGLHYPKILEIGVDSGQTALPLVQNLTNRFDQFLYIGVDILVQPLVVETFSQFDSVSLYPFDEQSGRDVFLFEGNSLEWLPQNQNKGPIFDMVLLDGDHNYFTVIQELEYLQPLLKPTSIIVCDDFNGRWANKDLFYSEKPEYAPVELATPRQNTEKVGVQPAVRDFLRDHAEWVGFHYPELDPILLYRSDVWEKLTTEGTPGKFIPTRDMLINFNLLKEDAHETELG